MNDGQGVLQVQTTVDDRGVADTIARSLVSDGLAACVQVIGPLASTYRWKGSIEAATEWLLLVKTTTRRYPDVARRLGELHPYDEPELIALPVSDGSAGYLRWVTESVVTD